MAVVIRQYTSADAQAAIEIWNEVVREGVAFPQDEELDAAAGDEFFRAQSFTGVAVLGNQIVGLYILHPNNVGRCAHIANASYAVRSDLRGQHIGSAIVSDSINRARELGFRILQFNAVVATNIHARHLYQRLGFKELGTIPGGFRMKNGSFADIIPMFIGLT